MDLEPGALYGAARPIEITPPVGVWLDGYGARQGPSKDVHDPLYATLLVLKRREAGIAIVACDLLAVSQQFTSRVRAALSPILEIPQENILVSASHTHSGPAGMLGRVPLLASREDPALQEGILRHITEAATACAGDLQFVTLGTSTGKVSGIGSNRNDPVHGAADGEVVVLRVDTAAGEPLALLVNYGCHPTVLGPDNLAISADFPGAARQALGKLFPTTTFLYTNGASGDVSTRFNRRGQGFAEVSRMGNILAGEVLKLAQSTCQEADAMFSGATRTVNLPTRQFPTKKAARERLAELEEELASKRSLGIPHGELRVAVTQVEGAQAQLALAQSFGSLQVVTVEIQALRIGPLAILGLPGEPFTRTVLDIKAGSPFRPTVVASYANDYRGYFPDAASVEAGTYEALTSPFDGRASERLAEEGLSLLHSLA